MPGANRVRSELLPWSSTRICGFDRSGDNARRNKGDPGVVMDDLGLGFGKLFVGDIRVPPLFLASGDGLRILDDPTDGVLARGDTGIQEIDRRRECPTERASFGSTPCMNAKNINKHRTLEYFKL